MHLGYIKCSTFTALRIDISMNHLLKFLILDVHTKFPIILRTYQKEEVKRMDCLSLSFISLQQKTTSAWIFQELSNAFGSEVPYSYKRFILDCNLIFSGNLMLGHFYSINSMASDNAEQAKLTNDEHVPTKRSFRVCKTALVAMECALPDTLWSEIPNLKRLGMYFGVYLTVGTICFYALEDDLRGHKTNDFIDSLYYCVTTMTTVGYGDLVPRTFDSRIISIVFVTIGMFLFGVAVKIAAKYLVVKQQMAMVNFLRTARKISPVEALKEIDFHEIDYNKVKKSLMAMGGHFVIGIFVLLIVEGMDFFDSIYCAVTTMSTTGFGDESFQTTFGRMFAVFWISTGTTCVGQLFLYIAEVYTDVETRKLAKQVIASNITAKKDLEAADHIEDDKTYSAADMILYKLKDLGKIKQDDISDAMKDLDDVIKDVDVDDLNDPAKSTQEK